MPLTQEDKAAIAVSLGLASKSVVAALLRNQKLGDGRVVGNPLMVARLNTQKITRAEAVSIIGEPAVAREEAGSAKLVEAVTIILGADEAAKIPGLWAEAVAPQE